MTTTELQQRIRDLEELLSEACDRLEGMADGTPDATPLERWANDWTYRAGKALVHKPV